MPLLLYVECDREDCDARERVSAGPGVDDIDTICSETLRNPTRAFFVVDTGWLEVEGWSFDGPDDAGLLCPSHTEEANR